MIFLLDSGAGSRPAACISTNRMDSFSQCATLVKRLPSSGLRRSSSTDISSANFSPENAPLRPNRVCCFSDMRTRTRRPFPLQPLEASKRLRWVNLGLRATGSAGCNLRVKPSGAQKQWTSLTLASGLAAWQSPATFGLAESFSITSSERRPVTTAGLPAVGCVGRCPDPAFAVRYRARVIVRIPGAPGEELHSRKDTECSVHSVVRARYIGAIGIGIELKIQFQLN